MKNAEDYAKMIYSEIKLVNVKEIIIRTIKEGLESHAKEHAIKFAKHFHNTTHFIVDERTFNREYTEWIKNKEQPTPSGE